MRPSLQTCAGVLWALALSMLRVAAAAAPAALGPASASGGARACIRGAIHKPGLLVLPSRGCVAQQIERDAGRAHAVLLGGLLGLSRLARHVGEPRQQRTASSMCPA